jgi:hypothetical protein
MSSAPPRNEVAARSAAPDRGRAGLRAEFRAIAAVYVFSALLPLIAGFACSSDRAHRMRQRARGSEPAEASPRPAPRPSTGATHG